MSHCLLTSDKTQAVQFLADHGGGTYKLVGSIYIVWAL